MFAAIGHFAEKIRRVGYGPLVLDVEPGKSRELAEVEVNALRLTAEGKMKPRPAKTAKMLPKEAGLAAEKRDQPRNRRLDKKFDRPPGRSFVRSSPGGPLRPMGRPDNTDRRPQSPSARIDKPRWKQDDRGPRREWQPRSEGFRGEPKSRPEFRPAARREGGENRFGSAPRGPFKPRGERPEFRPAPRQDRGENRFGGAPRGPFKPRGERPEFRPAQRQDRGENRFGSAPRGPFKPHGNRPEFRPSPRQDRGENRFGGATRAPFKPRSERPQWKRDDGAKPRLEVERISGPEKTASLGGGKPKPSFGSKPGFSGKPGSGGKYRGNTRGGPKRSFSRPGAPRDGRKRG
jgi:23S rRNA pseudouridine2605 synthase